MRAIVGLDLLAAVLAVVVAFLVRFGERPGAPRAWAHLLLSAAVPAMWLGIVAACRAYERRYLGVGTEEFKRVLHAALLLCAVVATASYATDAQIARGYVVVALPLALLFTLTGRALARGWLHRGRRAGRYLHRVVAVGHEQAIRDLVDSASREPHAGIQVVAACTPTGRMSVPLLKDQVPVLGSFADVVPAVRSVGADVVAVTACPEMDGPMLRRLSWQLNSDDIDLVVAPTLMEVAGPRIHIRPVSGLPLLHVEAPELSGGRRVVKGVVDRLTAAVALLLLAPLLIVIGITVRLTSRGPALFKQTRVGRNGTEFTMLKYRSMVVDAESERDRLVELNERSEGLLFKIRQDPRVTPFGSFLRRYSLDELPQLINVLTGSMSLVGPRPPLPSEVAGYADDVRRRLLVKPGLTGLWQISGRSDLPWDESVRLDLRYVENWSLALDTSIMWKTVRAVLQARGAY